MIPRIFLLVFIIVSSFKTDYRYSWDEKSDFVWSDFKAYPDKNSPYAANVHTGLSHTFSTNSRGKLVSGSSQITAYFYPKLSWYKPELVNMSLLNHERLHFKITQLHALCFEDRVKNFTFTENSKQEVNSIYQDIEHNRQKMQQQFDEETHHGLNAEAETKWEHKVDSLLAKY